MRGDLPLRCAPNQDRYMRQNPRNLRFQHCRRPSLLLPGLCSRCGEPISPNFSICETCLHNFPHYQFARNLAWYDGVIKACVQELKYRQNQSLGEWFAARLMPLYNAESWQADLVVPVPLSENRMKERGYNQAALIARPLAACLNLPYKPFGLTRVIDTRSQVGLPADQRKVNVAGAFRAEPVVVQKKSILVIDDVMTTGATLNAVSQALIHMGAKSVNCLTIARFKKQDHDLTLNAV